MSSEALERADEMIAALLAEVARLEQERDEAREQLQMGEADWARLTDVACAEAALAVAREREQRYYEALELIENDCANPAAVARAALVDEPAAAAPGAISPYVGPQTTTSAFPAAATLAEPGEKRGGRLSAEHPRPSKSGSASAAADEPGETL